MYFIYSFALLSVGILSQQRNIVTACSFPPRDGIYVENLRFVQGSNLLYTDLTLYDAETYESSSKSARINLNTGHVREASVVRNVMSSPKSEPSPKGYTLSFDSTNTKFTLKVPGNTVTINIKVNDYEQDGYWPESNSFFVDKELSRAYIFYNNNNYSTSVIIVNLINGSVVAKQELEYVTLAHSEPSIYSSHKVAELPGQGNLCTNAYYLHYDASSVKSTFTSGIMDYSLVTDVDGPLTAYRPRMYYNYDDEDYPYGKVESYSIEIVNLTTGNTEEIDLVTADIEKIMAP